MGDQANGDCFVVAAEIVSCFDTAAIASSDKAKRAIAVLKEIGVTHHGVRLCHGTVTRDSDQREHAHAWVELPEMNDLVVDFSNGHNVMMCKHTYYTAGRIKDRKDYDYYTARQMLVRHATYGPWEGEDDN